MSYSIKSEDGRVFKVEHKDGRKGVFSYDGKLYDIEGGGFCYTLEEAAAQCLGPVETKVFREQLWWLLGRGADEIRYISKRTLKESSCKIRNLTFKDNMVHYEKVGEVNPHRSLYITSIIGVKTPEGWYVV